MNLKNSLAINKCSQLKGTEGKPKKFRANSNVLKKRVAKHMVKNRI